MKINKKGFTLTELLVVIVILGIITGISVPLIRGLSATFEKKKYQNYADSVLNSAKLYNDSYSEDLFGHKDYGCAYITYDELVERDLLKDIDISGVSCNSEKTYIRVTKQNDKYGYSNYLGCGDKKDGKAENIKTSIPEVVPDMNVDSCTGVDDNNLSITATPNKSEGFDKKRKTTRLKIESGTGINNTIVIYTLWSKTDSEADKVTDWEKTTFKVKGNQEEKLLNGEIISTTSSEIITPDMSGSFHLLVRVENLQDLYGSKWKNTAHPNSNVITFGPFDVDKEPPTVPTLKGYKKTSDANVTSIDGLRELATNTWHSGWLVLQASGSTDNLGTVTYYFTVTGASTNVTNNPSSIGIRNVDAQGESTIKVKACDEAKNCSSTVEYKAKLDRTKPTITVNVYKANTSVNGKTGNSLANKTVNNSSSTATVTSASVTGNTNGWFGTSYPGLWYEYSFEDNLSLDQSSWAWNASGLADNASGYQNLGTPSTKSFTTEKSSSESHSISAEGHRYARFTVTDKAGNTSYINVEAKLDRTAPNCGTATNASTSWTKSARTIKQACSDSYSQCVKASYDTTYNSTTQTGSVTIADKAGNTKSCSYNVYVDTTAPSCGTATGASTTWTNQNRTIKQACSDSHSQCVKSSYDTTYNSTTQTASVTIADNAGNTKSCSYNVYVDTTAPSCGTATGASTTWTNQNRTIKQACSDSHSQCVKSSYDTTYSTDTTTASVTIADKAGNTKSCSYNVYVDKTPPNRVEFVYNGHDGGGLLQVGDYRYYWPTQFVFFCSDELSGTSYESVSIRFASNNDGTGWRNPEGNVEWEPPTGNWVIIEACSDRAGNSKEQAWQYEILSQPSSEGGGGGDSGGGSGKCKKTRTVNKTSSFTWRDTFSCSSCGQSYCRWLTGTGSQCLTLSGYCHAKYGGTLGSCNYSAKTCLCNYTETETYWGNC